MATNAKRQASIFLNGKEVEASAKNISAAFRQASNELGKMVIGSDQYLDKLEEVKRFDGMLKQHRDAVRGVEQGWNVAKSGMASFIGVAAGAFTVDAIIGYGRELLGTATNLELLEKKARIVFGEALPQVTAAAEENARAMGLTNAEYISAAANIQDLLVPMGFQRDQAAEMSTGLVDLSGALSEWSGGTKTAAEVSEILSKSLLGERDALNSLGIDIKQAEVDAELLARGLDKLTGEAKKQAEAMVTLDLIYRKSTDAQTAFANGSDSMARRQAENSARLTESWEKLAVSLTPIFEGFGTFISDVSDGVGALADSIASVLTPAKSAIEAFDSQTQKVQALESNIEPLLLRYDELASKTSLNSDEQKELAQIITTVTGVIPGVVTEFDKYGNAIGINTEKAREFIETEKARLAFINQDAIKSLQNGQKELETLLSLEQALYKAGNGDAEKRLNRIKKYGDELRGLTAELERLQGKPLDAALKEKDKSPGTSPGPSPEEQKAAEARAKEAARKREQDQKDLEAHLARIQDIVKKNDEAAYLDSLSADERELERVRMRYEKEIEQVKSKYTNNKAVQEAAAKLELQREEELEKLREEQRQKRTDAEVAAEKDRIEKVEKARLDEEQKKKDAEAAIDTFVVEGENQQKTPQEIELAALEAHYAELIALAEKYGIDTTKIVEEYNRRKDKITKDFTAKTTKDEEDNYKNRLKALQATFMAFADLASATFDFLGGESEEANELQKVFTLAKIAFDTASAISSLAAASEANPANAVTFGGAGIAQYIAGIARIVANFAQVRKLLSSAPAVKQKAEGGYLSVTGETDGRRYQARPLTPPSTGMLPGFPVVFQSTATGAPVLASERGAEYFVASHDLRNPYVANLVRMVDNITHGRGGIPQFQEGGANQPTTTLPPVPATAPTPGLDTEAVRALLTAVNNLNALLARGVVAVVPDRTITDINDRFKEINEASGGFFS